MPEKDGPTGPKAANLTTAQMKAVLPRLHRRLEEVIRFSPSSVRSRSDPTVEALETKLKAMLDSIYPLGTIENERLEWRITRLDRAPLRVGGISENEIREGLRKGQIAVIGQIEALIDLFQEEINDAEDDENTRALRAYENLDLHPEIERAAGELYRDGHYSNAILDAVIALNDFVRLRSGISEDGDKLMTRAFKTDGGKLRFNDLVDENDKNEQRGFMYMFQGAVAGLRNPRAHKIIKDDPERALEFIAFVSLLAKLVDGATRVD